MSMLDELQRLLWRRSKHFEYLARTSITVELADIYRAKAAEAYSIYIIIENMKKKAMKDDP